MKWNYNNSKKNVKCGENEEHVPDLIEMAERSRVWEGLT